MQGPKQIERNSTLPELQAQVRAQGGDPYRNKAELARSIYDFERNHLKRVQVRYVAVKPAYFKKTEMFEKKGDHVRWARTLEIGTK